MYMPSAKGFREATIVIVVIVVMINAMITIIVVIIVIVAVVVVVVVVVIVRMITVVIVGRHSRGAARRASWTSSRAAGRLGVNNMFIDINIV